MSNHTDRVQACKLSVKKSAECIQICQKCSDMCKTKDGVTSTACQSCVIASKESLVALKSCLEKCEQHNAVCTDQKCIANTQIFLQKCRALITAKEECSHFCNSDNALCIGAYHRSLNACKEFIEAYNTCFDTSCDGCCLRCDK